MHLLTCHVAAHTGNSTKMLNMQRSHPIVITHCHGNGNAHCSLVETLTDPDDFMDIVSVTLFMLKCQSHHHQWGWLMMFDALMLQSCVSTIFGGVTLTRSFDLHAIGDNKMALPIGLKAIMLFLHTLTSHKETI
jgi:hypothetical protein